MADKKIAFRRIHGRIVPIKVSQQQKDAALIGAGRATVGAGAAVGAGALSGHLMREAAGHENVAKTLVKVARSEKQQLFHAAASRTFRLAAKNRLEAMRLHKTVSLVKKGGFLVGSALIGAGVHKALEQTRFKEDEKTKAAIATGSGLAAAFGIRSAYGFAMQPVGRSVATGAKFTRSVSSVLKHAAMRVLSRGVKL